MATDGRAEEKCEGISRRGSRERQTYGRVVDLQPQDCRLAFSSELKSWRNTRTAAGSHRRYPATRSHYA